MINIKDTVKNPAQALEFMLKGLATQDERVYFGVDMSCFGRNLPRRGDRPIETCWGCAAVCAVQEIAGRNLTSTNVTALECRAEALGFNEDECEEFESAIDRARRGQMYELWRFFRLDWREASEDAFPCLDEDWRDNLTAVKKFIKGLRASHPHWA